jgi:hypothetical protein
VQDDINETRTKLKKARESAKARMMKRIAMAAAAAGAYQFSRT